MNVLNLLRLGFDFLQYPALDTAHDGAGVFLLCFFPKCFQIPGLIFV